MRRMVARNAVTGSVTTRVFCGVQILRTSAPILRFRMSMIRPMACCRRRAVASPILKAKSAQLVERDFTPTFTVGQMIKDLNLILAAGATSHVPLAQTAMTLQLMHAAAAQGDGLEDYAVIIKSVERSAGLNVKLE